LLVRLMVMVRTGRRVWTYFLLGSDGRVVVGREWEWMVVVWGCGGKVGVGR
jgi:hypothetical protein